jgi:hypothetical protein
MEFSEYWLIGIYIDTKYINRLLVSFTDKVFRLYTFP